VPHFLIAVPLSSAPDRHEADDALGTDEIRQRRSSSRLSTTLAVIIQGGTIFCSSEQVVAVDWELAQARAVFA
jgi:hypothetical protein